MDSAPDFADRGVPGWLETAPSLVAVLRRHALESPGRVAYRFLHFEGEETREVEIRFGELDRSARAIAVLLQASARPGDRVVLACPPGLDYLCAFFGGLYAGLVVVPAYPPLLPRAAERLEAIVADCEARILLSVSGVLRALDLDALPGLRAERWIEIDREARGLEALWKEPPLWSGSLAYLQYTSGSTGSPKGVQISHATVLANLHHMQRHFAVRSDDVHLSWAPPYHDLGLIAGLLLPVYVGGEAGTGMSPFDFVSRPARWLEALSRRGASVSGAPNFAYELCARKIPEDARRSLDLSRWEIAYCGGEPIRADTIERFCATFASCGFRREAFAPCYGQAELTLCVTGSRRGVSAPVLRLDRNAFQCGRIVEAGTDPGALRLVGNGAVFASHRVRAVDPETRAVCAGDRIGELWIRGPVVAQGYWQRREESAQTYGARLGSGEDDGEVYLRSGDLGFVREGEVFVAGRLKDLIIVRGVNHYPQDIELSVERCHAALRPGCGAAFAVERDGEERLAIVHEVRPGALQHDEIALAIRTAVREHHELAVEEIALLAAGMLPKTTSGKVSRRPCRSALEAGTLPALWRWSRGT